jgi:hypothetical protein
MLMPQSCAQLLNSSREGRTQICDDSIGHAEAVLDILDELDCFGCAVFLKWFVLDPLGELVNSHKDVVKTTLGFLERSYLI